MTRKSNFSVKQLNRSRNQNSLLRKNWKRISRELISKLRRKVEAVSLFVWNMVEP